MSHSLIKCCVHALWATKERQQLIKLSIEQILYNKIERELNDIGCVVRIINGMPDHVHCLFELNPEKSISDTIKQVKGSSSHWVNQQHLLPVKFAWQTGSAVYSVSESQVERVYNYIKNQKIHHRKKTWQDEFEEFIRIHGINQANTKGK